MNERKDDIQHLLELLLVVLDGNASEQEYARLNETLRQSEVSRRIYTDFMMTYVGLNYLDGVVNLYDDEILDFNSRMWQDIIAAEKNAPAIERPREEPKPVEKKTPPESPKTSIKFFLYTAIISSAALIFIILGGMIQDRLTSQPEVPLDRTQPVATLDTQEPVAILGRTLDAVWQQHMKTESLPLGEYVLESGYAQIDFLDGAQILVEAPCAFELTSRGSMILENGTLTSQVPREARGFTVETSAGRFVDLGTEFGLTVTKSGDTDTAVFEGTVEVTGRAEQANIVLHDNQEVRTTSLGVVSDVETLDPEHHFRRSWEEVYYLPKATGACRILRSPPVNLMKGQLEDTDAMVVFLERRSLTLTQDIGPVFCQTGLIRYDPNQPADRIARGRTVDSYLIHFDPAINDSRDKIRCRAQIHFPRPVIGVAASSEGLWRTDVLCGSPEVVYPRLNPNDVREASELVEDEDVIVLSPDRRSLTCEFQTILDGIDQLRVLIEAVPVGGETNE